MLSPELRTASIAPEGAKPRDDELDLFGLTHPGRVRKANQDHFLLCTIHPQVVMHATSLERVEELPLRGQRLATLMLVADGVGSTKGGGDASQLTAEILTRYLSSSLHVYLAGGVRRPGELEQALQAAALEAHAAVVAEATARDATQMATTLTLALVAWPWVYVLQVGDSRCYHWADGKLRQVTRDQTMAQALVDEGALPRESLSTSPLSHVLVSAIGGEHALPEVARLSIQDRSSVLLLCSDGLTKHVSDAEIAAAIAGMQSSEQLCRDLCSLALERGGSDNITILAGRAPRLRPSAAEPAVTGG